MVVLWPRKPKPVVEGAERPVPGPDLSQLATSSVVTPGRRPPRVKPPSWQKALIETTNENDVLPEMAMLREFAQGANLYKFDPAFVGARIETNWLGRSVNFQTKSHNAMVLGSKLITVQSLYYSSDTQRRPEEMREWYKCSARWTEKEAAQTTMQILASIGDKKTLESVDPKATEYVETEMRRMNPKGETVLVTPFPQIWLKDKAG